VRLTLSRESKPLGTAGPLTLLKERLTEPFMVMNGDILSLVDFSKLYQFGLEKRAWLTIAIKRHVTPYAFGNVFFEGDVVTGVEEKPKIVKFILAGIYVMRPEIFTVIPSGVYYGMDQLIKDMLRRKLPVVKYDLHEYWLDIGQPSDYQKAQEDAREGRFNT
jgi:NDP-sugar pyrophosphorylase family protein